MARTKKAGSSTRKTTGRRTPARGNGRGNGRANGRRGADAIAMLREDHQRVQEMFKRFERTRADEQKSKIAETICDELKVHAQIEEEIFYPAVREATDDAELIGEATVEHQSAKDLIRQIERMSPDDELFEPTVKVLGEYVGHHIKEEQNEIFPKVRKAGVDLKELGEAMKARKEKLTSGFFSRL